MYIKNIKHDSDWKGLQWTKINCKTTLTFPFRTTIVVWRRTSADQ